jgi:hypothetical protein
VRSYSEDETLIMNTVQKPNQIQKLKCSSWAMIIMLMISS